MNAAFVLNYIPAEECSTMPEPDVLRDGVDALSDSEECSDSDEELMWGWMEESQECWIPKLILW